MGVILLLALIGVPLVEIAIFIEVGGRIGLTSTVAAVIVTAIAGSALLRHQGLATLDRGRKSLEAGHFPMAEVFDGLCLMFAGALLLTPGFLTDAVGLLLFVPALRRVLQRWAGRYLVNSGRIHATGFGGTQTGGQAWGRDSQAGPQGETGTVIDGEYSDVTEDRHKTDDIIPLNDNRDRNA